MRSPVKPVIDPSVEIAYLHWLAEEAVVSAPGTIAWRLAAHGWLMGRATRLTSTTKKKEK